MTDENNAVPATVPQVVTPVVETESQLTAPLIDHATRVTRIEERQAQHAEEMARQIAQLEERLQNAASSQVDSLRERISGLEERLAASVERVEETPEAVELDVPDIAPSPAPPEKVRQGMRHRRKAKRKGGK